MRSTSRYSAATLLDAESAISGQAARDQLDRAPFVYRIAIGMQKGDCERADALQLQRLSRRRHRPRPSGSTSLPLRIEPSAYAIAKPPWHDSSTATKTEVVHMGSRHVTSADFDDVAETLIRDQTRRPALALKDRIQPERRSMHEQLRPR